MNYHPSRRELLKQGGALVVSFSLVPDALAQGADIVITGRVADAALSLGPLMHELNWRWDDWDRLAQGLTVGHLLECSGQASGGNFGSAGEWAKVQNFLHLGYPIALWLLTRARRPRVTLAVGDLPRVSLIIAAHDEGAVIADKVANALALDYPRELLEVIVASDGSTDRTVELARAAGADQVLELPRGGKLLTQNAGAAVATGEILAFGDANARFRFDHLRARRFDRRLLRVGGGARRVELHLRHFVLRQQSAVALDVLGRLRRVVLIHLETRKLRSFSSRRPFHATAFLAFATASGAIQKSTTGTGHARECRRANPLSPLGRIQKQPLPVSCGCALHNG